MALFDAFLKLDGIKGESADAKHKGEIDIMNFGWGASQTGVQSTGGGGGAGKVRFHDLCILKKSDASSPLLMLNCANGAHLQEATLTVCKAGGEQLEYLKIKLTDVLVSSYKPHSPDSTIDWGDGSKVGMADGSVRSHEHHVHGSAGGAAPGRASLGDFTTSFWDDWLKLPALADTLPVDLFSLNFAKVEFAYQPQGADGKAQGGPIIAGWDVKGNKKT